MLPNSASKYFDDKDRYIQETLRAVCQKIILLFWKTVHFQMDNTTACLTMSKWGGGGVGGCVAKTRIELEKEI